MPEAPVFFFKPPTAVVGPDDAIVYPAESRKVFYEAELAVVIGRRAWRVAGRCRGLHPRLHLCQ